MSTAKFVMIDRYRLCRQYAAKQIARVPECHALGLHEPTVKNPGLDIDKSRRRYPRATMADFFGAMPDWAMHRFAQHIKSGNRIGNGIAGT